jgi:Rrf2 family transcriptional regulator, iron-sulfur cluster assembly transcription factor
MQLLSLESDYGLRAVIYLSCRPKNEVCFVHDIAKDQLIPTPFLFKILRKLVRKGLVKSYRGPHGGYTLARNPSQINFLEVIEAIDGPLVMNRCLDELTHCQLEPSCKMLNAWQRIQRHVTSELSSLTIADLLQPLSPQKSAAS